jgi:hypothetical protein
MLSARRTFTDCLTASDFAIRLKAIRDLTSLRELVQTLNDPTKRIQVKSARPRLGIERLAHRWA